MVTYWKYQRLMQDEEELEADVQEKRLFSYIMDLHIPVKETTHALRCIDKAGRIDKFFLKMPYQKMDTELGLYWKTKIEKLYDELGKLETAFFSPEDEAKFEEGFKQLKLDERELRRMFGTSKKDEGRGDERAMRHQGSGNGSSPHPDDQAYS